MRLFDSEVCLSIDMEKYSKNRSADFRATRKYDITSHSQYELCHRGIGVVR